MDLDATGSRNELQRAVYRAVFKLRSLQKLCRMEAVTLSSLVPALQCHCRATGPREKVTKEDVESCLYGLFQRVQQDLLGQMETGAVEHTTRLLFKLFDREQTGFVSLSSVEVLLTVLSGDGLSNKHTALFQLAQRCSEGMGQPSGMVTESGLRAVLSDVSKVPAAVQEGRVFGPVDTAVDSCFRGMTSSSVTETQFARWLQSEPQLLLWLSALDRISASEDVFHRVRCHVCKAFPVVGLRFRCLRCLNVHLCQMCFVNLRGTRKHKASHPVLMCCTQPTLREAAASFARNLQHKLNGRLLARSETEKGSALAGPRLGAPVSAPLGDDTAPDRSPKTESTGSLPRTESKAMQTDTVSPAQKKSVLLRRDLSRARWDLWDLQWEKRTLERELMVLRASSQAENSSLKNRCCHLEANMEVLTHHNQNLQDELGRVRQMLEAFSREERHQSVSKICGSKPEEMTDHTGQDKSTERQKISPGQSEDSRDIKANSEVSEKASQAQPRTEAGHHIQEESQMPEDERGPNLQQKTDLSDSYEKQEQQLSELVQWLKDTLAHHQETGPGEELRGDLLAAAEGIGSSISKLVSTVSISSDAQQSLCVNPNITQLCQAWTSASEHTGMTVHI